MAEPEEGEALLLERSEVEVVGGFLVDFLENAATDHP